MKTVTIFIVFLGVAIPRVFPSVGRGSFEILANLVDLSYQQIRIL
jgi:hypothetical protein